MWGHYEMKCPMCSREMKRKTGKYRYTESGLDNVYLLGVEIYKCHCGETAVSIPAIMELHKIIGTALIKKDRPLTGKEIRFLRKNIGMSAKGFAEVLGIDRSTLSRWENDNQVLSATNDRLIRLAYSNFRGIAQSEIKQLMKDKFKEIKPGKKGPAEFTIPITEWADPEMCAI